MMKLKFPEGISGASHEGVAYYPDETGHADLGESVPQRVVDHFHGLGFEIVCPEAAPVDETDPQGTQDDPADASGSQEATEATGEPDSDGTGASDEPEKAPEPKAAKKRGK